MTKLLGTGIITALFTSVVTVFAMNWLVNDDPLKFFLGSDRLEGKQEGISRVNIGFTAHTINVDVHLEKSQTCSDVVKSLGIGSFKVKDKKFTPTCSEVNEHFIRIVYTESIDS